ncbi:hypothetical protein BR93DRAFT_119771 [Coniochaeta sp. PMI_546]|nr:hypothetical protein BR93DRAFT_119771 [Coniochaeta sp. PMI_546]
MPSRRFHISRHFNWCVLMDQNHCAFLGYFEVFMAVTGKLPAHLVLGVGTLTRRRPPIWVLNMHIFVFLEGCGDSLCPAVLHLQSGQLEFPVCVCVSICIYIYQGSSVLIMTVASILSLSAPTLIPRSYFLFRHSHYSLFTYCEAHCVLSS